MRTTHLILAVSLALVTTLPVGSADDTVTVTLVAQLDAGAGAGLDPAAWSALPGTASCSVTVPAGANVGDVLDQAAADLCIAAWTYDEFEGFGRIVTSIDGVYGHWATWLVMGSGQWWEFFVDGGSSALGIDSVTVSEGATYEFLFHSGSL